MNPLRLVKRITEYVTQIGIEMAIVDGLRKIVRVGEYEYVQGEVRVRDLVSYNYFTKSWEYHEAFSEQALKRLNKHDIDRFAEVAAWGIVDPCS